MLLTIVTLLFVVVFLIVSIPILLIELLIKKISPMTADLSQLRIVTWAFGVVEKISGAKVTVIGKERVPKGVPVLYVSNHQSYFDIVLAYGRMRERTGFVGKKSLEKIPILSSYMKRLYCLFLDREDIRQGFRTIQTAIEYVKQGISVYIFPEGTRNETGDDLALAPFHDASFKIAQRGGCPVVPIAINNSSEILENHFPRIKKAPVILEYGEPIDLSDLTADERKHVGEFFRERILQMLRENQKLL